MNNLSTLSSVILLQLSSWAPLIAQTAPPHRENPAVQQLEEHFADLLDAHGAVEAIRSGLLTRVDSRALSDWDANLTNERDFLSRQLKGLEEKSLASHEVKIVRAVRRGVDDLAAEGPAGVPDARCEEAADGSIPADRLSSALYACFDSIGNRIEFEGALLTRVDALQLLQELPEPARRRALFYAMAPLWQAVNADNSPGSPYRRLLRTTRTGFEHRASPADVAAEALGVNVAQAERWLLEVLEAWRRANSRQVAGIEPWDYRYRYSVASRRLSAVIPKSRLLPLQQRFYAELGADPQRLGILFDIEPRAGKAPLAYADTVRIGRVIEGRWRPALSRVSANDERGGLGVLNELVHETGHAVHYMAIRARPAFFWPDNTFIEAFADVPSWAVFNPEWQKRYLGVAASRAEGLQEQYAGVMLDVAWSVFEIRLLREPTADPNLLWSEITQHYLNIVPHPEISWWAIRSQLVTDPGYMINYGLGAIITADIRERTRQAIGSFDSGNREWYRWTSAHLLRFGGSVATPDLLRKFLGHPVGPGALVGDIATLGGSNGKPGR